MNIIRVMTTAALASAVFAGAAAAQAGDNTLGQPPQGGEANALQAINEAAGGVAVVIIVDANENVLRVRTQTGGAQVPVFLHPDPAVEVADANSADGMIARPALFGQLLATGERNFAFYSDAEDRAGAAGLDEEAANLNAPLFVVRADGQFVTLQDEGGAFVPAMVSYDNAEDFMGEAANSLEGADMTMEAYDFASVLNTVASGGGPRVRVIEHPETREWGVQWENARAPSN